MLRDIASETTVERMGAEVEPADALGVRAAALDPSAAVASEHAVVAVVGLGYVGLPTAIALRDAGCRIVGLDSSPERLAQIRGGEAELLDSERDSLSGHLEGDGFVLTDRSEALNAADLVMICVPTPIDEWRTPDTRALRGACASVVRHARPGQTIVLTSTTYVGCTRELLVGAARRARAARRRGRVRRVRPRAHRPRRRRAFPDDHAARARRGHRDVRPPRRRRCCNTLVSACTASPRPRPPRWSSCTRTRSAP